MFIVEILKSIIFGVIYYSLYGFINLITHTEKIVKYCVGSRNFLLNIIGAILCLPVLTILFLNRLLLEPLLPIFQ